MCDLCIAEKNPAWSDKLPAEIRRNLPLVEFESYLSAGVRVNEKPKIYCRFKRQELQLVISATNYHFEFTRVYRIQGYYDARKKIVYAVHIEPRKPVRN
jgi:hypothetical protein